jgi:para-aminobenzoate synthetase component 1
VIKHVTDPHIFKQKALQWAATFNAVCYLDSNNFNDPYSKFDTLIAVGVKDSVVTNTGSAFKALAKFRANNPGWLTGFFSYDLKNEIENLSSNNPDHLQFPDLCFFAPEHLILINGDEVEVIADNTDEIFNAIDQQTIATGSASSVNLQSRLKKDEYISIVNKIKDHIARGDIYVTNFCQEFFANATIDPVEVFLHLSEISPNPFGTF